MEKEKSSRHLMIAMVLLPPFLFALCTIVLPSAYAQPHFILLDGSYGQKTITSPGKNGPVRVQFKGYYKENLLAVLDTIAADYNSKIQDSDVHVKYSLSSAGHWYRPSEGKNSLVDFAYLDVGLKEVPRVQGFVKKKGGGEERLATFEDVVFTITGTGKFSCWLVSHSSWPAISRTDALSSSSLRSSGQSIKFTGENVSFFWVEKDFTLTFDEKPVWPRGNEGRTAGQKDKILKSARQRLRAGDVTKLLTQ